MSATVDQSPPSGGGRAAGRTAARASRCRRTGRPGSPGRGRPHGRQAGAPSSRAGRARARATTSSQPAPVEPLDDLAEQARRRGWSSGRRGAAGSTCSASSSSASEPLLVGRLEVLPDVADRLALQARGVGEHLPDGNRGVPGAGQVGPRAGRRASSRPSSRSDMTSTAVKVLVIEPIMNCVSSPAGAGAARAGPTRRGRPDELARRARRRR